MHRLPLIVLTMLVLASSVHAAHKLRIYSDSALTDSTLSDSVPRVVTLYVVESGFGGATGVIFSTEPTPGFTGVWLSDASSYLFVGNSQTSITIGYGTCHPAPVLALTMTYQLFGTSSPCSELRIAPPDGFQCAISPDSDCHFFEICIRDLGSLRVDCALATEPSTWGRVKALYRN